MMTKQEILSKLNGQYKSFSDYVDGLDESDYMFALPGKWSAGQQVDHLIRAVKPLNRALLLPHFLLKLLFGKANRQSRSYGELVTKYQSRLEAGGRASGRFIARPVQYHQKATLSGSLSRQIQMLLTHLNKLTEAEWDRIILPHPLLGKLTLREMMYFTIYHAVHHHQLTIKYLSAKDPGQTITGNKL